MELQLKNIGMIKEANVKIDGLTVIAGENDTGKSTVGKTLFTLLKARTLVLNSFQNQDLEKKFLWLENLVFKQKVLKENSQITLKLKEDAIVFSQKEKSIGNIKFLDTLFIESPIIFNFYQTFKAIANANSILDFKIPYSYLSWDIYLKLAQKSKNEYLNEEIKNKIINSLQNIIRGDFKFKNEMVNERWVFNKENKEFELENVATGIKQFGLLLVLFKNGYISEDRILILDEPEVHLHPKWQLEMAKVIVEFVKNGVKVLVNSHSPYMIEALKRYSDIEKQEDKTNFYLAEGGYIKQINNNNSETLEKIFLKLSEPFDIFEEMEANSLEKLING